MSFVLVVRLRAKEGNEARAVEVMQELSALSLTEPGCDVYVPSQDPADPRSFLIYEIYRDKAAWQSHGETEHFLRLGDGELYGLMESHGYEVFETF